MEDLKNIILEIIKYRSKEFNPSDDIILDCATRIFNSQNAIFRKKPYVEGLANPTTKEEKASAAQINLLYNLEADFDADKITKKEAYHLIKKLKGVK